MTKRKSGSPRGIREDGVPETCVTRKRETDQFRKSRRYKERKSRDCIRTLVGPRRLGDWIQTEDRRRTNVPGTHSQGSEQRHDPEVRLQTPYLLTIIAVFGPTDFVRKITVILWFEESTMSFFFRPPVLGCLWL